jgi:hypothetical protein
MRAMFVRVFVTLTLLVSPALADKYKDARVPPPLSKPYPCDCPDDGDARKYRCGGRSAWCKAGGREPDCTGRTRAGCKHERQ